MTNAGLLSVIVPVYNVETYLNQCISSIINQTYENLEILLIDDGSTDRSGMICDQYAVKDTRIRVVHQENQGLSGARNVGTDLAQGQYVAYVDSDDWLDIHMYDELLRILQKHKLDMVRCAAFFSDGEKKEILSPKKEFQNQLFINEDVFKRYFDEFLCKVVWNAVYKKDIVKGILSPERCHSQDNYVSGMYLYRSKDGDTINASGNIHNARTSFTVIPTATAAPPYAFTAATTPDVLWIDMAVHKPTCSFH